MNNNIENSKSIKRTQEEIFALLNGNKKLPPDLLDAKQLLKRTFVLLLIAIIVYVIIFFLFGEYLQASGEWFGKRFGLWGVFVYVFIVDAIIVPTTPDVVFAIALEWEPISLLIVMSIASILGGFVGYLIGNKLNKLKFVKDLTASYREKGELLIKKYGIWAIVIAALTPVPYTTVSWIGGMVNLKKSHYILGSLARIPRFIIYYLLIKGGITGINVFLGS
jgi:membrane protein YqaA with SNARE-associated domain